MVLDRILGRNTCGTTVSEQVDAYGKSRFVERCIVRNHGLKLQFIAPLFAERGAYQAPAVHTHKIDDLGMALLAAVIKSPSFSRSSSSTTITSFPV